MGGSGGSQFRLDGLDSIDNGQAGREGHHLHNAVIVSAPLSKWMGIGHWSRTLRQACSASEDDSSIGPNKRKVSP